MPSFTVSMKDTLNGKEHKQDYTFEALDYLGAKHRAFGFDGQLLSISEDGKPEEKHLFEGRHWSSGLPEVKDAPPSPVPDKPSMAAPTTK